MKYILIIAICFLGLTATSQVQKQGRSNFPTVVDSSLAIGKNFILPVFRSFSQLSTYTALDSSGRLVFIRDSNAVFYRTNAHTWAKLGSGGSSGSVAWGSITGTLSNQTDLQAVLDTKVDSVILRGGDSLYNHYSTGEVQFIGIFGSGSADSSVFYTVFDADTSRANIYAAIGNITNNDTLRVIPPLFVFGVKHDSLYVSTGGADSTGVITASDWNYFAVKPDSVVLNSTGDTLLSYLGSTIVYSHAIAGGSGGSGWSLTGNGGTSPAVNFIGTTDDAGLLFKTNNIQSGLIDIVNANTSFGKNSLVLNVDGTNMVAVGEGALQSNLSGKFNTALGYQSLGANVNGEGNTAIGDNSMSGIEGGGNTAVGQTSISTAVTGNYLTALGSNTDISDGLVNATAIGALASVTDSNCLVLGSIAGVNSSIRNTKVGIGTTAPTVPLHVVGDGTNTAAFMNGNVGIGTTTPAAKLHIASSDSNAVKITGLTNTVLATDSALVIGTDGNVKKAAKSSGGSLDSSNLLTTTATRTATGSITFTNLINTTPKVHYWGLNGQSNAENQAVAGDSLYPYKKNWTPNVQIQVNPSGDGVTWVTANRYTNNIAGGSIVRENSAVVAAQEYLVSHPYDTIKLTTVISSGKALSYWTKDLTGFGEKDSVSTGWYIANTKYSALPAASLEVIFWQQGEQNQNDTTVKAWTYMMKRLDSAYKTLPGVSPNLKMIFSYPTTTYSQVRAMLDSIDNGLIDMSSKNWTVVKNPFTTGVDATHLNNYQQWRVGRMFNTAFQFSSSNPVVSPIITRPGQNFADSTVTFKPAPTSTALANITLGTTTRFTNRPIEFTQNVLANSLVTLSGPGAVLRVITTATTGGQIKASTIAATLGQFSSMQYCQGLTGANVMAETRGVIGVGGGGYYDIATSTNGSTLVPKFRVDSAGNTLIAPTVVGLLANSTLQVSGSFAPAYVAKTATYTATASDHTIECTANTFTVTLPTAVGCAGREYFITNSGAGTITIATTSSQTFVNVSGTPTTLTLAPFASYLIYSNNAAWLAK